MEAARRMLAREACGKTIVELGVRHPTLRRCLPPRGRRALRGRRIERIERRGKHQLMHLSGGLLLHVHFRMTGDWTVGRAGEPLPRFARAWIDLDDGTRLVLEDPRALSSMSVRATAAEVLPRLGPEPLGDEFTAAAMAAGLARRRGPIKPALLDQRLVAGLGNIYAAEALWLAKISPRAPAASLHRLRVERLVRAVRHVLEHALAEVMAPSSEDGTASRFRVYDREGLPCRRCAAPIRRIVQAGRSTYYCPRCQRA